MANKKYWLYIFVVAWLSVAGLSFGAVIVVGHEQGDDFDNIKQAILNANSNDTIKIRGGIWVGIDNTNLVIDKNLTLKKHESSTGICQIGNDSWTKAIETDKDNQSIEVTLDDLTFYQCGVGESYYAVQLYGDSDVTHKVKNCTFMDCIGGLALFCSNAEISNCNFKLCYDDEKGAIFDGGYRTPVGVGQFIIHEGGQITVKECYFEKCSPGLWGHAAAISSEGFHDSLTINDCDFYDNDDEAIFVYGDLEKKPDGKFEITRSTNMSVSIGGSCSFVLCRRPIWLQAYCGTVTIRGASIQGTGAGYNGEPGDCGIRLIGSNAVLRIDESTVIKRFVDGVLVDGTSTVTVEDSNIQYCEIGIRSKNALLTVERSRICDCSWHGIYCDLNLVDIKDSILAWNGYGSNKDEDCGGGVYTKYGGSFENCTLVSNKATSGSAIYVSGADSTATIKNCIVGNMGDIGGASYTWSGNVAQLLSAGNGSSFQISYCCLPQNVEGIENINADPHFSDNYTYQLFSSSLCIDAGDPTADYSQRWDVGFKTRVIGTAVDIGACEYGVSNSDRECPTPNPLTWNPAAPEFVSDEDSYRKLRLIANPASGSYPIEYQFVEVWNLDTSPWQTSNEYLSLVPYNRLFVYQVHAKYKDRDDSATEKSAYLAVSALIKTSTTSYSRSMKLSLAEPAPGLPMLADGAKVAWTVNGQTTPWLSESEYWVGGLSPESAVTVSVKLRHPIGQVGESTYLPVLYTTAVDPDDSGLPTPMNPEWDQAPSVFLWQASMQAETVTDPDGGTIYYYFEDVTDASNNSGWQTSTSWTDHFLEPGQSYTYRFRARDDLHGTLTNWSSEVTVSAPVDSTPPTPNPMTWDANDPDNPSDDINQPNPPYVYVGLTMVQLQASEAQDDFYSTVYYAVECPTDPNLNTNWQSSPLFDIRGLVPNKTYQFQVKAKDYFGNETQLSVPLVVTTDPEPSEVNHRALNLMYNVWFDSIDQAIFEAVDNQALELTARHHDQTQIEIIDKSLILRSANPDDPDIVASTVIDSNGLSPVIRLAGRQCRLEGLTIIGGRDPNVSAGGVLVENFKDATLENCIIYGNTNAGIWSDQLGDLTVRSCKIEDNSGIGINGFRIMTDTIVQDNYTGGASVAYGGATITNCIFRNNTNDHNTTGSGYGGGLTVSGDSKVLSCVFADNQASKYGGGLVQWDGDLTLGNCTFINNTAGLSGGGLECRDYCSPVNCIFWGNTATDPDGGDQTGGLPIQSPTDCMIEGVVGDPNGPQFIDDEYHIDPNSPCYNAGASYLDMPDRDFEGQARIWGGTVDIGADEYFEPDVNAPNPDPMTWAEEPFYINPTTIRMRSFTATDDSEPVMYYFQCSTDPNLDSDWQLDSSYVLEGLVEIEGGYSFRVKARDAVGNETDWSAFVTPSVQKYNAYNRDRHTWHIGIQSAIDEANSGDTIEIIEGTHAEPNTITIYGKDIELQSSDPTDPSVVMGTRISGVDERRVIHIYNGTCELRGLTICEGLITDHRGGGIYCEDGALTMSDCIVEDCSAMYGGGISIQESHATLTRCLLADNSSIVGKGGGIQVYGNGDENLTLDGCALMYNIAGGTSTLADGGGVYFKGEQLTMTNCSLIGNSAGNEGGGLYVGYGGDPSIVQNCLFWANTAPNDTTTAQISGDDTKLYGCLAQHAGRFGGYINHDNGSRIAEYGGDGFFNEDPNLLEDPTPEDPDRLGYHLEPRSSSGTEPSPCIDAGDDTDAAVALERDLDGDLRQVGPGIDIGADEYHVPPITPLAEALDVDDIDLYVHGWTWAWAKQTAETYDGEDAVQSQPIGTNQSVAMTTQVEGPCNLRFQWKVSSLYYYHLLEFYVDEERQAYISGDISNWLTVDCNIYEPGWHDLKWRYVKNQYEGDNDDCGWVDQLEVDYNAIAQAAQIERTGIWYGTIQAAIDAAEDQDVIVIVDGTHTERLDVSGVEDLTLRSIDPDDWLVTVNTVIDGTSSNHDPVVSTSRSVTLEGLTLTGGVNFNGSGGGVYCSSSCYNLIMRNCVVSGNTSNRGGGIFGDDTTITLANCIIEDNESFSDGGGIYAEKLNAQNVVVQDNEAHEYGGGIYVIDSVDLENCTIINNQNPIHPGGGLFIVNDAYAADLTNCILWGNVGGHNDSAQIGIDWEDPDDPNIPPFPMIPTITNSFVAHAYANSSEVYDSTTDTLIGYGSGTLWLDVNPILDGYHLTVSSPCINEAVSILGLPDVDIDGEARVLDGALDIGADEAVPMTLGPLAQALDCSYLFSTGGSGGTWFKEDDASHQGGDAARSGPIGDNEDTWMETTVEGQGTVTFRWKVDSESGHDFVEFKVNNVLKASLTGNQEEVETVNITGPYTNTLHWRYYKDGNASSGGEDCALVDALVFTPDP